MIKFLYCLVAQTFASTSSSDHSLMTARSMDSSSAAMDTTPNLFEEVRPLLDLAIATFSIAQLRDVARRKLMEDEEAGLITQLRDVAREKVRDSLGQEDDNKEEAGEANDQSDSNSSNHRDVRAIVEEMRVGTADDEERLLRELSQSNATTEIRTAATTLQLPKTAPELLDSFTLYKEELESFLKRVGGEKLHRGVIESANATLVACNCVEVNTGPGGTELVYMIFLDDHRRRIVVTFRGSITWADWAHDSRVDMKELDNPFWVEDQESSGKQQPKKIRIHHGFHSFLLDGACSTNGESKFDQIMGKLRKLLQENQDYAVYVSGHSLGGAASTLFAFMLAMHDEIPKPIVVASFGSPLVGDASFAEAFGLLEQQGRVRHLRVASEDDIVPSVPISSPPVPSLQGGVRFYRHVGINLLQVVPHLLLFWRKPSFRIVYPEKAAENTVDRVVENAPTELIKLRPKSPLNHVLKMYHKRLNAIGDELRNLSLVQLYNSRYDEENQD